jgi:glycosyltransferase involved in cell wall biosynthesis
MNMSSPAGRKIRLAYIVNSLNPGGTEKLVVEMSLAMRNWIDLEVICLDDPGTWAADLRARGIAVTCLWRQPGLDLSIPWRLARHLRRMQADIAHAHQCTPWFYAALSRLFRPSTIVLLEEHGRFYPEADKLAKRLVNRLLICPLTSCFVAVSADIRTRLGRYEGIDIRRIEVVYNGVAAESQLEAGSRVALRRELGLSATDFVVGTVGRFDPIKNLDMLIDALSGAMVRHGNVRGLLVGDGPEFARITARIREQGLEHRMVLTGYRADARRLTQVMDLFVLSSLSEGTSMALLEALAAGVPVAVTRVGGNPEVVGEGQGWLVASGAVPQLAQAICEAVEDPARRSEFAAAGRQRFQTRFTFAGMIDRYREIYERMMNAADSPG